MKKLYTGKPILKNDLLNKQSFETGQKISVFAREKFIETGIKTVKEKFAAKHQIDEFNKMLLEVFESSKNQKINIPKL